MRKHERADSKLRSARAWDEVWSEYDLRTMPLAPLPRDTGVPETDAAPSAPPGTSLGLATALVAALVALGGVHVTRSAIGTAASITSALASGDADAIRASRPDWAGIRSAVERDLGETASGEAVGAPETFIGRMASDVADAIATPEGLAGAAALRLAPPAAHGIATPRVVVATGSIAADGLRFGLSAQGWPERVAVTVVPTMSPPGWRVGTVRLLDACAQGFDCR